MVHLQVHEYSYPDSRLELGVHRDLPIQATGIAE
jgi:hypothetical protein